MSKLYAKRDIENLDTYGDHLMAMTSEGLMGKSDVAAELAYRDSIIEKQASEIDSLKAEIKRLCEGRRLFSITKEQHKIIEQQQQEAHIKRVLCI